MSERGEGGRQERRLRWWNHCLQRWDRLFVFPLPVFLHWQLRTTTAAPELHPYTSQAAPKPHDSAELLDTNVIFSAWQEEQQWSATGSCTRTAVKPHPRTSCLKAKSGACVFFWISYQACTEGDRRAKGRITVCLPLSCFSCFPTSPHQSC